MNRSPNCLLFFCPIKEDELLARLSFFVQIKEDELHDTANPAVLTKWGSTFISLLNNSWGISLARGVEPFHCRVVAVGKGAGECSYPKFCS